MIKNASEPVAGRPMREIEGGEKNTTEVVIYYNRDGECDEKDAVAKQVGSAFYVLAHKDGLFYNNLYDPYETTLRENTPSLKWTKVNASVFEIYLDYVRSRKRGFYDRANLAYGSLL